MTQKLIDTFIFMLEKEATESYIHCLYFLSQAMEPDLFPYIALKNKQKKTFFACFADGDYNIFC